LLLTKYTFIFKIFNIIIFFYKIIDFNILLLYFFPSGTPLHAIINKYFIPQFRELIQERNLYTIKNIKIVPTNETYKSVKDLKKAWFLRTNAITNVQYSESTISRHYFEFVTIEAISERLGDNNVLSDSVIHKLPYNNINYII
jgi:hypothetical protein